MTYGRFPAFRTGLNPSKRTLINPLALTPTQRMELARNRVWGNYVGGNSRSGYKELKMPWVGQAKSLYYEQANLKLIYPFINTWKVYNARKLKYEERKNRIFMRGIKIGARKGGDSGKGMSMFEQGSAASKEAAAKV